MDPSDPGQKDRGTATDDGRDRRVAPRIPGQSLPGIALKLSSGTGVRLIDLSRTGVRFESDRRLLPGSMVALQFLTSDEPLVIRGRIRRSRVTRLQNGGLGYEVALVFDRPFRDLRPADYGIATAAPAAEQAPAAAPRNRSAVEPVPASEATPDEDLNAEDLTALPLIVASVPHSREELWQVFNGNNW